MKVKKRLLGLLLCGATALSLCPPAAFAEGTDLPNTIAAKVSYRSYEDGYWSINNISTYTTVDANTTTWGANDNQDHWYVVSGAVTISQRVTVTGKVHLILVDDCNLTINGGIHVGSGNALSVYAQSTGDDMGVLTATGTENAAGIGGNKPVYQDKEADSGTITINGGKVTATGNGHGAGIGGGRRGNGGTCTVNGGVVTAIGGSTGSGIGIGGVTEGGSMTLTINGGIVKASCGSGDTNNYGIGHGGGVGGITTCNITINGGYVEAIGSRNHSAQGGIVISDNLQINGGFVVTNNIADSIKEEKIKNAVFFWGADNATTPDTYTGKVYGDVSLSFDTVITEGMTLTIPTNTTLTVTVGTTLTNNGTITGSGTLGGNGEIKGSGTVSDDISNGLQKQSSVAVSFNPETAVYGSEVEITATISQASANVLSVGQNQVEFFIGTGGSKTSLGKAKVNNNVAKLSITLSGDTWSKGFQIGSNTITAEYGGSMELKPQSGTEILTVKEPAPLSTPGNLTFTSTTPGKATAKWGAVDNASGYSVQLYKGETAQGNPVSVTGATHTFTITDADSYTFKVKAKGTGNYADSGEAESGDLTFHEVTFNLNGGSDSIESQIVANGGKVSWPTADPTKAGHTFDGWYSDNIFSEGNRWDFSNSAVSETTTLYAKWTAINYTVTVTVEGGTGSTASASSVSATIGTQVTLTATPAGGYHLAKWEVMPDDVTIKDNKFTMPAEDVKVKAVFAEHQYSDWRANGNDTHTGTCSCGKTKTEDCSYEDGICTVCGYVDVAIATQPQNATVKEGQTATFTVAAKGGGISYQWQVKAGDAAWADISGATGSSYTTGAATMEMGGDQYRCIVSNTTGDSATSSAASLTVQKTTSAVEPEFIGYFVEHYKKNPVSGEYGLADREYRMDAINKTVTATQKDYTGYTCNPKAEGTIASETLKEIKSENDIVTLRLYYDPNTYNVQLVAGSGAIAEGKDVTGYTYGVGATLPTANDITYEGHAFKGWYANSDFSGDPVTEISKTDTGNKTYYAKWAKLWTVTVSAGDGGTVSGGGTFEENATVTVTATPNSGYRFVRWEESGKGISNSATYSFALTEDRTLTAVFSHNPSGGVTPKPSVSGKDFSHDPSKSVTGALMPDDIIELSGAKAQNAGSGAELRVDREELRALNVAIARGETGAFDVTVSIEGKDAKTVVTVTLAGKRTAPVFTDLAFGSWYEDAVLKAAELGYINGHNGKYRPTDGLTRAEAAAVLFNMAGGNYVYLGKYDGADTGFTDTDNGAWYATAVAWANATGVVNGHNGSFRPNDPVTRAEFAAMLSNLHRAKGGKLDGGDISRFPDASQVPSWAETSVSWAAANKIMGNGGKLSPNAGITRAEVAAMAVNYQPDGILTDELSER